MTAPLDSAAGKIGSFRWSICGLLFCSVALNYIDRNIIGILKGPLSRELHWTETDYAHIASAFQFAYAFGYLLGGRFMDRIGVKRGLPLAVLLWSMAAAAHGLCSLLPSDRGFHVPDAWILLGGLTVPLTALGFISARVVLGLAEGGNFPGAIKTVAEWFPVKERALATGLFNAGTNVGAILCPFAVPRMYAAWGWPVTFYLTGALGLFWLIGWWRLYENLDEQPRLSDAERTYIRAGQTFSTETPAKVPWHSLLGYRAVWAYLAMSVLAGPVWNIYMFFLPDFLQKRHGLELISVGNWTAVFYFVASFGGIAGGWLAGHLLDQGGTVNAARKTTMLLCALAVVPIYAAPYVPSVWLTVLIVGLAGSAHQGWSANQFSFASDTMPKPAISSLVGLGGFVAYFTGGFMTEVIGLILKRTGSYASIFAAASVMYLASLLIMHLLVPHIGKPRLAPSSPKALPGPAPVSALADDPLATNDSAWCSDQGDGTYRNPVLYADYSDPDAIRVGDDFWLTASSFSHVPGLPLLHSRDLVNWSLVNHALPRLVPLAHFSVPRHGGGVWAPSLRYHDRLYRIYYPDPDFGLYLVTAPHPTARWSEPHLVKAGRGLIDPCPFWDDDGQAFLVHGWAKSRSGVKNRLTLHRLSPDGTSVTDEGLVIIDGDRMEGWHTIEGPKLYKRGSYYYIFTPAGGVREGYQAVFRARQIEGPYEAKIVLTQGSSLINGPHQGAWVDTPLGEDWFLHFQELPAYGRVVHLQPMRWRDDWPEMGLVIDERATSEPVLRHRKPAVANMRPQSLASSDEFEAKALGQPWQWQANPRVEWASLTARPGWLRLHCVRVSESSSLWSAGHLLLQKFSAPEFEVTTRLEFFPQQPGDAAGLLVFGTDYASIELRLEAAGLQLLSTRCVAAHEGGQPFVTHRMPHASTALFLRVTIETGAVCQFSYSEDGRGFTVFGESFQATSSFWVGAKVGLFATASDTDRDSSGHADFDWFRVHGHTRSPAQHSSPVRS